MVIVEISTGYVCRKIVNWPIIGDTNWMMVVQLVDVWFDSGTIESIMLTKYCLYLAFDEQK